MVIDSIQLQTHHSMLVVNSNEWKFQNYLLNLSFFQLWSPFNENILPYRMECGKDIIEWIRPTLMKKCHLLKIFCISSVIIHLVYFSFIWTTLKQEALNFYCSSFVPVIHMKFYYTALLSVWNYRTVDVRILIQVNFTRFGGLNRNVTSI